MSVLFPYSPQMAGYDFGPSHPMRPERFTLAVELMQEYGLLVAEDAPPTGGPAARVVSPEPASAEDLLTVHSQACIEVVTAASEGGGGFFPRRGIGAGDTPAFHRMHEVSALICGGTIAALRSVVEGDARRSMSVAGGLHHAMPERAAGFCVYNDPVVAIAVMLRDHPGLRVAYVDIDAHHGDGVEAVFATNPDVLTISVHESGRYLFPGTGAVLDTGIGAGKGFAINVPLPPLADDACYRLVLREVIAPALEAFAPDVIIAQCGADTLHTDPLTHLALTLPGYAHLVRGLVEVADKVCSGRICATGGGGYDAYVGTPRAWTLLLAALLGVDPPPALPEAWRERVSGITEKVAPAGLLEDSFTRLPGIAEQTGAETASVVERVRGASPLLRG